MAVYPEIIKVVKQDTFDQWRLKHNILIDAIDILNESAGDLSNLTVEGSTLVSAANEIWQKVSSNEANIGDLSLLTTTSTENLVSAINSLKEERESIVGELSDLITDDISSIVSAINSLDVAMGKRSQLTTEETSSFVNALNQLDARVGDLSLLQTDVDSRATIVDAINNVIEKIGGRDLSLLQTDVKSSLINSINELVGRLSHLTDLININADNIGDLTGLMTDEKGNVVGAINELHDDIGNLATLKTDNKNTVVAAINEIHEEVGDRTTLTTVEKNTLVGAINEINVWQKNAATDDLYFQGAVAIGKDTVDAGIKLDVDGTIKADKFVGDLEGNVKGNVTGNVTGNVSGSAAKWAAPITLSMTGDVSGSVTMDGSTNVTLNTTLPGGPYASSAHNHDDRYVKLSDKRDGVYVNVRNTGSTSSSNTGLQWAFYTYPNSSFSTGDFLFVDRKFQTTTSGYNYYQRRTITKYYRDIWLKYTTTQWMLISSTQV